MEVRYQDERKGSRELSCYSFEGCSPRENCSTFSSLSNYLATSQGQYFHHIVFSSAADRIALCGLR